VSELVPIPWATQSTKAQSGVVSAERLVNCYLEVNPASSKGPVAVYGDAGLKLWGAIGAGPIRGSLLKGENLFVVSGTELYAVTADKVLALIGTIPGNGDVAMIANATHVGIATNLGFCAATLDAAPVLVDGNRYTSAAYMDGIGILALADSEQFFVTGVDDMLTINPLDFSSADTFADMLAAVAQINRELVLLGAETLEHWYPSGDAYFPFARTPGGVRNVGCAAAGSVVVRADQVFWLANDGAVYSMSGYQPKRISTPGIEREIKALPAKELASAVAYGVEGHDHYVLNFITASFAYDITTGLWRDRATYDKPRWRVQSYVRAFGLDLAGDFESGNLYELDPQTYDDNAQPFVRTMQSAPIHGSGRQLVMHKLYIDCEMGAVQNAGGTAYEDPQFMLSWSDDGGKTWSAELTRSAGKTGEATRRAVWTRLGRFYQRTIRLSISDKTKLAVVGAYAEMEQLAL